MKNKAILCLLLVLLCLHVYAQQRKRTTTQRRVTTTAVKKTAQPTITKTRMVGKDGFVWYELNNSGHYGAANVEGKTIIPTKYMGVYYEEEGHCFRTQSPEGAGIYTRSGTCVIPESLGISEFSIWKENGTDSNYTYIIGYILGKGLKALYDMNGNEVIPFGNYESLHITTSVTDVPYIKCKQNGLEGAFDLNGNVLISPRANCYISVFKDKVEIVNEKDGKHETDYVYGSFSANTHYNYKSIDYSPMGSSQSSSSSLSSSSSSNSSSSSSGHQQRQVWKERWRNCTACDPDRRGYCRNCHGRGGYYIGNIYNVCGICGGTGSCTMCGGRGEYKETYSTWE